MVLDETMRFADRQEAGRALADQVRGYLSEHGVHERPLVLGMSPGGVPVAAEVARAIGGELDVIVVARIGLPWRPEFGVGALAENGPPVINYDTLTRSNLSADELSPTVATLRAEVAAQASLYRDGRPAPQIAGRVVIVVDDGMLSGMRARAALRALHAALPSHLVFATPVCAAEATGALAVEADGLVHVRCPCCFSATGLWYRDIPDLTDEEITAALRTEHQLAAAH
jgi:putative phosphoribosyl transferase